MMVTPGLADSEICIGNHHVFGTELLQKRTLISTMQANAYTAGLAVGPTRAVVAHAASPAVGLAETMDDAMSAAEAGTQATRKKSIATGRAPAAHVEASDAKDSTSDLHKR